MIHPLLVHFPIALLTFYAILELIRFEFVLKQPYWFYIKASLSIIGVFFAFLALASGDGAEHYVENAGMTFPKSLIEIHAGFAATATIVFGLIASSYAIQWLFMIPKFQNLISKFKVILIPLQKISNFVAKPSIIISLSIVGVLLMTVVGGLGASMVYGQDIDPLAKFVYSLFEPLFVK